MSKHKTIAQLERHVARSYQNHSAKRLACAALSVGVVSIGAALVGFGWTSKPLVGIAAFAAGGLLSLNFALRCIVPPTSRLKASQALVLGAIRDPSRILAIEKKRVHLLDAKGEAHTLNAWEQKVWNNMVIPHLLKSGFRSSGIATSPGNRVSERPLTNAERKVLEKEKAELRAREKEIQAQQSDLLSERKELERRTAELSKAENLVIDRLTQVEVTQAELEQLRADVDQRASAQQGFESAAEVEALRLKESELQAKEAELEQHKQSLEEDRKNLEAQKTDLNQLKGELVRQHESAQNPAQDREAELEMRERLLEERMKALEETAADLEARSQYVSGVEDSLIDRLNLLSEREASVEQSEVNAGVRKD